jgi:uncharacterized delta-60 repeat protein
MKAIFPICFLFFLNNVLAQNGQIDSFFNQSIIGDLIDASGPTEGSSPTIYCVVEQPDGKILVGGDFYAFNRQSYKSIVRLFPNGKIDTSFHSINPDGPVKSIVLQDDGRIVIGGYFTAISNVPQYKLSRLESNGEIDFSFNIGTAVDDGGIGYVLDLFIDDDGKIIVAGSFNSFNNIPKKSLVRLNTDGSIDNSFDIGNGPNSGVLNCVEQMPDGSFFIGGSFTQFDSYGCNSMAHISSNGVINTSFISGFPAFSNVKVIKLDSNNNLFVGGAIYQYNFQDVGNLISLFENGTLNETFSPVPINGSVEDIAFESNNRIIAVGDFNVTNGSLTNNIICLEQNGNLSSVVNFNSGLNSAANSITVKGNGEIIVGGSFDFVNQSYRPKLVQFKPNGSFDENLLPIPGPDDKVTKILALNNNQSIVAGNFSHYNGTACNKLIRLNSDGLIDTTFHFNLPNISSVDDIIKLPFGGYALICYDLIIASETVIRIDENGNIDPSFVEDIPDYTDFIKLIVQPDGKLLVSAWLNNGFGDYNGGVIRLNTDGSKEIGFLLSVSSLGNISTFDLLPNGKIIVCTYNQALGSSWGNITARFNSDGSYDQSFNISTQNGTSIFDMMVLPSGQIMLLGGFNQFNGFETNGMVRLNYDGSIDTTFFISSNLISFSPYSKFQLLSNGKILISGTLNMLNLLNSDGSVDSNFELYSPTIGSVSNFAIQDDGSVLIGGDFKTGYEFQYRSNLLKVQNDIAGLSSIQIGFSSIEDQITCADFAYCNAIAYFGLAPYSYEWIDAIPPNNTPFQTFQASGIYDLKVTDANGDTKTISIYIEGPTLQSGFDLDVNLVSNPFRPGFNSGLTITGLNHGCIPTSGVVRLDFDPQLTFLNANPLPSLINGNTLFWDFSSLEYSDSDFVNHFVLFNTPANMQIGDSLLFDVFISPTVNDGDTSNNHKTYVFEVVNSYDPNFIEVFPNSKCDEHFIQYDKKINYLVHFQNTGNAEAVNIKIDNAVDTLLDLSSLRIVGGSANCWTEILENGMLRFHFDSIMLIDSITDPIESQGFIQYELSMTGINHGKQLDNQAFIYFDYNPAIVTNQVFSTVYVGNLESHFCELGTSSFLENIVSIDPNPFNSEIKINRFTDEILTYTILDLNGKIVDNGILNEFSNIVKLSNILPGFYLIKLINTQGQSISEHKIIKI